MPRLVTALVVLIILPLSAQGPDAERIEELVRQLGAESSEEREEASRLLREIGAPAVEALRAAAKSSDPERRARAADLLPYVRWGLTEDSPPELHALLAEFESAEGHRRGETLLRLAERREPEAAEALYSAWWEVEDPELVTRLAMSQLGSDSDLAEERLRALASNGGPELLVTLAGIRWGGGDPAGAADLYARAAAAGAVSPDTWSRALFEAHRYAEVVDLVARWRDTGPSLSLRAVECLFRLGRRAEAEDRLRALAASWERSPSPVLITPATDLALRYGAGRILLEENRQLYEIHLPFALRAWIREGEFDRAEEVWRMMPQGPLRGQLLEEVLLARGDRDLATMAFLAEASEASVGAGAHHLRLAVELAETDPDRARAERTKAALLDPGSVRVLAGTPGPPGGRGFGCWGIPITDVPEDLLFESSPVRVGDFFYYANGEGDLVKTGDPRHPMPAWVYLPPQVPRLACRGWSSEVRLLRPGIARWKTAIVALYERQRCLASGTETTSSAGHVLCVVDAETGRGEWTRTFPDLSGGAVFPEAGLVTFAHEGLSVFDLDRREWRWSVTCSEWGDCAAWARGDAIYLGSARGFLAKLRASDGSLVWKKSWPVLQERGCSLVASGGRLVFCLTGERLVCLSQADDSILWEAPLPSIDLGDQVLIDDERVYVASRTRTVAAAYALSDGSVRWRCRVGRRLSSCTWGLADRWLYVSATTGSGDVLAFVDLEVGRLLCACFDKPENGGGCSWYPTSAGLCVVRAGCRESRFKRDGPAPRAVPKAWEVIVVPGPDPFEDGPPETPTSDRMAAVSWLEEACHGASARDGRAWKALAEASIEVGRVEGAVHALSCWVVFSSPGGEELRAMRVKLAGDPEGVIRHLSGGGVPLLESAAEDAQAEKAFLGLVPRVFGPLREDAQIDLLDLVAEGGPPLALPRATALLNQGCSGALPVVATGLVEADDAASLEALRAIVAFHMWRGPGEAFLGEACGPVREAVRAALQEAVRNRSGAPRGAALAVLELLDGEVEAEDADPDLRQALNEVEPRVRLPAAAALARRGAADARDIVLDAIRSGGEGERDLAVWLAGHLRLEEAVELLVLRDPNPGGRDLLALSAIGTPAAWEKVLAWGEAPKTTYGWFETVVAMRRSASTRAVALLRKLRGWGDHVMAFEAHEALVELGDPGATSFARLTLRLDPDDVASIRYLVMTSLGAGDPVEARRWFDRLAALVPPTAWLAELEGDLLAAEGDIDGAAAARSKAEERVRMARTIDPTAASLESGTQPATKRAR